MSEFTMEIAGIAFGVECRFESTMEYCRRYFCTRSPEYRLEALPEERLNEQHLLDVEAGEEGLRRRIFTEPFLERAVLQRKVAAAALEQNVLLLHGSTVAVEGRAYLFTARTGTGKSTHTRYWRETLQPPAIAVNDDRTFLRRTNHGVLAYGAPWSGKHGLDNNLCVPLAGICILERGTENQIHRITADSCLPELRSQTFVPYDHQRCDAHELVSAISAQIPLWRMRCTKDPSAAALAYSAMHID